MSILGLAFILLAHYITGRGFLALFQTEMSKAKLTALSFITGVVLVSMVPFILQLLHLPITFATVLTGILVTCFLFCLPLIKRIRAFSIKEMKLSLFPSFGVYEWPFMILFGIIVFASVWRAFYFPPNARDMLSGPEVIAEYTVREHTMINSVFNVNLETTNNHQKPPFITGLQIIYKLFGFPFGQVWLSVIFVSFCVFLYQVLRERLHAVLACTLMLLFFSIPEMYAYSFVMLFDYSNMVLFFLACYCLHQYFRSQKQKEFYLSVFLFGFATYIRLETLVLVGMFLPAVWLYGYRKKTGMKSVLLQSAAMIIVPYLFYFLWVNIFLRYYMPVQFNLGQQINPDFSNLQPLITRFKDINSQILFGQRYSVPLWGYFLWIFITLAAAELIFLRKLSRESRNWLYALAVVYFGLPLLGYLIPLVDLLNTTKRGLFKMFPIMIMLLANNGLLIRLSDWITNWETGAEVKKAPAVSAPPRTVNRKTKAAGR